MQLFGYDYKFSHSKVFTFKAYSSGDESNPYASASWQALSIIHGVLIQCTLFRC